VVPYLTNCLYLSYSIKEGAYWVNSSTRTLAELFMDLSYAIKELIEERNRIDATIRALEGLSGGPKPRKKRVLSEDARKRIADGQRRRRAREKKGKG
jgi:hypothetical protein